MRILVLTYLAILLAFFVHAQDAHIHVNQFGYYPDAPKVAVLSDPVNGFNANESYSPGDKLELRKVSTDEVIYEGQAVEWNNGETDALSGDRGWHFDFSEVEIAGEYYILDPATGEKSPSFKINDNPYLGLLKAATKMYYYNRCGIEKVSPYADQRWTDGPSFEADQRARYIYDQENTALEKDLSGGWFDAGDYNKYVTFNYSVIHNLLSAYEWSPTVFTDDWNIPESGNGLPDILDEVKWELEWMRKMMNNDGSVIVKMGSRNHNENSSSPPSANSDTRYYGPTCTAASATLASNFAHAALVFAKQYNYESYANELAGMAGAAFDYVVSFLESETLETQCDDGSIVAGDADLSTELQLEALVNAAIYLYEFNGLEKYQNFIKAHTPSLEPVSSQWWGPYKLPLQDALLRYTTLSNADAGLAATIRSAAENAERNSNFYRMNDETLYRDFIPDWSYHWGSNNPKAGYGNLNLLMAAYEVNDAVESQMMKAEELLHSFHGVNPLGLVYLSNMYELGASKSINELYHLWFYDGTKYDHALDSEVGPAPGYVVGGPNKDFSVGSISPPSNQPPTKSYLDYNTGWPDNSWEISEPAIYYQANYIRLLSQIISRRGLGTSSTEEVKMMGKRFSITPNPTLDYFIVKDDGSSGPVDLVILDVFGRVIRTINKVEIGSSVSLSDVPSGSYLIKIREKGSEEIHQIVVE